MNTDQEVPLEVLDDDPSGSIAQSPITLDVMMSMPWMNFVVRPLGIIRNENSKKIKLFFHITVVLFLCVVGDFFVLLIQHAANPSNNAWSDWVEVFAWPFVVSYCAFFFVPFMQESQSGKDALPHAMTQKGRPVSMWKRCRYCFLGGEFDVTSQLSKGSKILTLIGLIIAICGTCVSVIGHVENKKDLSTSQAIAVATIRSITHLIYFLYACFFIAIFSLACLILSKRVFMISRFLNILARTMEDQSGAAGSSKADAGAVWPACRRRKCIQQHNCSCVGNVITSSHRAHFLVDSFSAYFSYVAVPFLLTDIFFLIGTIYYMIMLEDGMRSLLLWSNVIAGLTAMSVVLLVAAATSAGLSRVQLMALRLRGALVFPDTLSIPSSSSSRKQWREFQEDIDSLILYQSSSNVGIKFMGVTVTPVWVRAFFLFIYSVAIAIFSWKKSQGEFFDD